MFRDYKVGTIVGYETGGLPITFGGPHRFTLKNSRIPCSVSWTENFPARPWPGDDEHGVTPDVPLSGQELADFKTERDPVLAFTLRYIKTGATPPIAPQRWQRVGTARRRSTRPTNFQGSTHLFWGSGT